jgi:hypothetical protein
LVKIFFFKVRVVFKQLPAIWVGGKDFQDAPNGDAHAAEARMSAHFAWLDRDPL